MTFYYRYMELLNEARLLTWGTELFANFENENAIFEGTDRYPPNKTNALDSTNLEKWEKNDGERIHKNTLIVFAKYFTFSDKEQQILEDKIYKWDGQKRYLFKPFFKISLLNIYKSEGKNLLEAQIEVNRMLKLKKKNASSIKDYLDLCKQVEWPKKGINHSLEPVDLKYTLAKRLLVEQDRYRAFVDQISQVRNLSKANDIKIKELLNKELEKVLNDKSNWSSNKEFYALLAKFFDEIVDQEIKRLFNREISNSLLGTSSNLIKEKYPYLSNAKYTDLLNEEIINSLNKMFKKLIDTTISKLLNDEINRISNMDIGAIEILLFDGLKGMLVRNKDGTICLKDISDRSYLYIVKNRWVKLWHEKNRIHLMYTLFRKINHPQAKQQSEELMSLLPHAFDHDKRDIVQFIQKCDDDFIELAYTVFHLLDCNDYQSISKEELYKKIKLGPFGYILDLVKSKTKVEDEQLREILGVDSDIYKGLIRGSISPDESIIKALRDNFEIYDCDLTSFYGKMNKEFIIRKGEDIITPKYRINSNQVELAKIQKFLNLDSDYILIKNKDSVRIYSTEQD